LVFLKKGGAALLLVFDQIFFAEIFNSDDCVRHGV